MWKYLTSLLQRKPRVEKVDIVRRFELISRVGQGSMSKVWKARDSRSGRIVALKVLDLEKTRKLEARFDKRLKKPTEGEIAIQLKHPRIVETTEYGMTTNGEQYLVMEYVEGMALSVLIDAQNDVMKKYRVRMMIELGDAIQYFHRQQWIHRDICPRNVLLDMQYHVKLIDFGLVVPNTPPYQAPGNRTGTANYMAPELVKRQRTDQRIDIFSYAVTCYEMCAGRMPWDAAGTLEAVMQHMNTPATDLRAYVRDIDPELSDTIMKGLELRPDDRWQTMAEMLQPLRQLADATPQG